MNIASFLIACVAVICFGGLAAVGAARRNADVCLLGLGLAAVTIAWSVTLLWQHTVHVVHF